MLNCVVSVFSEKLVTMTWQTGWWRFSMSSLIGWPFTCMGENQVCCKRDLIGDTTKYTLSVYCKSLKAVNAVSLSLLCPKTSTLFFFQSIKTMITSLFHSWLTGKEVLYSICQVRVKYYDLSAVFNIWFKWIRPVRVGCNLSELICCYAKKNLSLRH